MNLKHLSDDRLLLATQEAAQQERLATTLLLHHLCEIQRRRLFARFACASLFEYCVKHLQMSESQAARRVNAARALAEFPEIENSLHSGELSLTAVSQAQSFFNKEAQGKTPIAKCQKREIFDKIVGKSTRETERVLLSHSSQPERHIKEIVRPISPTWTEIKFAADEELMNDLDRLKEIWSHEMPNPSMADLIKKMAHYCILKLDPLKQAERAQARRLKNQSRKNPTTALETPLSKDLDGLDESLSTQTDQTHNTASDDSSQSGQSSQPLVESTSAPKSTSALMTTPTRPTPAPKPTPVPTLRPTRVRKTHSPTTRPSSQRSRYIPATVRHTIWLRDQGACTYVDPITGEQCQSRHRLQIDHIRPFAKGGENSLENLRLRCLAHNQWHAIQSDLWSSDIDNLENLSSLNSGAAMLSHQEEMASDTSTVTHGNPTHPGDQNFDDFNNLECPRV